jgi:glycosyltransferase involved in cell wall biosynthesis
MKVFLVHPGIKIYGGAEHLIVKLCNHLTARGIDNALLTTAVPDGMRADIKGSRIIIAEKNGSGIFSELFALKKGIEKHAGSYDIINVHNYPADIAVVSCKKKCVWMCNEPELYLLAGRSDLSLQFRLYCRLMLAVERYIVRKRIKCAVVSDRFNAERFFAVFGVEPHIVPYGIDYDFFYSGDGMRAIERFGLGGAFAVLQIGILSPFKNQMASLEALNEVKGDIPNIKLILAGQGEEKYKKDLEEYAAANELEEYVVFTGHLCREDIRDLLHGCDLLIHPVKAQGGWLSPFEALSVGKWVIVSDEMTAADMIKREGLGIVTSRYADAIRDVYRAYMSGADDRMTDKGRLWVKENLSWQKFGDKMIAIYEKVLSE